MTREEFFNSLNTGTKWDVGVAINRNNPLPLDASSVYESLEALTTYAQTSKTVYVGQICTVVGETEVAAYQITAIGEGATVVKLAASSASGDVAGDIVALQTKVGQLEGKVGALETAVGNAEAGLVKDVADNKAAIEGTTERVGTLEGKVDVESVSGAIQAAVDSLDFSEDFDAKGSADTVKGELDAYKTTNDAAVKAADDKAVAAQGAVDAVAERVATVEGDYLKASDKTELEGKITAEAERADAAEKALDEKIASVEGTLSAFLEGEAIEGSTIDTLKEIQDYITTDGAAADKMVKDIAAVEAILAGIGGENDAEKTVVDYVGAEIGAVEERVGANEIAIAANAEAITTKVAKADYDAKVAELVKADEDNLAAAKSYADEQITALNIGDYAKTADVNTELDKKADKGTTLAEYGITDAYTKGETETKIAEMISDINGGESAGEVLASLNAYKTSNDERVGTIETKLGTIEENAEVNIIETVKVNGTVLSVADKAVDVVVPTKLDDLAGYTELAALVAKKVDAVEGASLVDDDEIAKLVGLANIKSVSTELQISEAGELGISAVDVSKVTGLEALIEQKHNVVATDGVLGVVMSNAVENGVVVAEDGKMSVNSVNVNKLTQTEGEYLILNGGSSVI